MPKLTADELYRWLLERKTNEPNRTFDYIELLQFGDVRAQMEQLEYEGKIKFKDTILDSFDVIG